MTHHRLLTQRFCGRYPGDGTGLVGQLGMDLQIFGGVEDTPRTLTTRWETSALPTLILGSGRSFPLKQRSLRQRAHNSTWLTFLEFPCEPRATPQARAHSRRQGKSPAEGSVTALERRIGLADRATSKHASLGVSLIDSAVEVRTWEWI